MITIHCAGVLDWAAEIRRLATEAEKAVLDGQLDLFSKLEEATK